MLAARREQHSPGLPLLEVICAVGDGALAVRRARGRQRRTVA